MRLFVEAVVDPRALDDAWAVGQQLRDGAPFPSGAVRWVKREAMHLTLRFLGEQEEPRAEQIAGALASMAGSGRIELRIVEVGTFGGRRPRVIWLGVARDRGFAQLAALRQRLDAALSEVGLEAERGVYRPHLTLGRVRRRASAADLAAIRAAVNHAPPLDIGAAVTRAALVESTLLADGPRYRRLAITEL